MFQPLKLFVQRVRDHNMVIVAVAVSEQEARQDMKRHGLYYDYRAAVEPYEVSRDRVYNFMCGEGK